jgi:hypothetical protein
LLKKFRLKNIGSKFKKKGKISDDFEFYSEKHILVLFFFGLLVVGFLGCQEFILGIKFYFSYF